LTAVVNDYGFERLIERQIEVLCRPSDVVARMIALHIIMGITRAREMGAITMAFLLFMAVP
jgi:phosphoheptose isomerase